MEKKHKIICEDYLGSKTADGTEINQNCNSAEALVDEEDSSMELGDITCEFKGKGEGQCPFFKYRLVDKRWLELKGVLKTQIPKDREILEIFAKKLALPDLMILAEKLSQKENMIVEFFGFPSGCQIEYTKKGVE